MLYLLHPLFDEAIMLVHDLTVCVLSLFESVISVREVVFMA